MADLFPSNIDMPMRSSSPSFRSVNYSKIFILGRFLIFGIILVLAYMFVSPLYSVSKDVQTTMSCSQDFNFLCFISYVAGPVFFITIILLALKYLKGEQ